jgi:limonene-1,2-epoxide hydrolase
MSAQTDLVTRFLKAWEPAYGFRKAMPEFLTADVEYENVGVTDTRGLEDAVKTIEGFVQGLGFASMIVQMRSMAASGNVVLTERVDDLYDAQGRRLASLRVMGVFEVRDGKIAAWRDYFDSAALAPKA